jgi:hypothetical protein
MEKKSSLEENVQTLLSKRLREAEDIPLPSKRIYQGPPSEEIPKPYSRTEILKLLPEQSNTSSDEDENIDPEFEAVGDENVPPAAYSKIYASISAPAPQSILNQLPQPSSPCSHSSKLPKPVFSRPESSCSTESKSRIDSAYVDSSLELDSFHELEDK